MGAGAVAPTPPLPPCRARAFEAPRGGLTAGYGVGVLDHALADGCLLWLIPMPLSCSRF